MTYICINKIKINIFIKTLNKIIMKKRNLLTLAILVITLVSCGTSNEPTSSTATGKDSASIAAYNYNNVKYNWELTCMNYQTSSPSDIKYPKTTILNVIYPVGKSTESEIDMALVRETKTTLDTILITHNIGHSYSLIITNHVTWKKKRLN